MATEHSNKPGALRSRFLLAALAALGVALVAGMAIGYVATKRAVPYFIRIGFVDPAVHQVRAWLNMPEPIRWRRLNTHFGALETAFIPITFAGEAFPASIEDLDGDLLVMTMHGAFFYMTPSYELRSLDMTLPMNREGLGAIADSPDFNPDFFRAHDLLAVPTGPHAFDLYASYDRFTGSCFEIAVARRHVRVSDAGIEAGSAWEDVFVAKPCLEPQTDGGFVFGGHQVGGRLALLDAETLLLSLGDVEYDGNHNRHDGPQDPTWDIGKIVAISLRDGSARHLASGFRNPQGLLVDSQGRIWEAEHGPRGGDEVNLIRRGANYGWPLVTFGLPYGRVGSPHTRYNTHDGFTPPVRVFVPAIGPSQLVQPSTQEFPFWDSCLLLASLRAESIHVLRISGDSVVFSEPVFVDYRIRDLLSRPNGELAMVTEERAGGGGLILMRAAGDAPGEPFQVADHRTRAAAPQRSTRTADASEPGRAIFQQACATCHSLSGAANVGPPLNGVVGRDIGSAEGFEYSAALSSARGAWTPQRLRAFLAHPEQDFAGSAMPAAGLSDAQADEVIAYLRTRR